MADSRQKWRQIHAIWSFFPMIFTTDQAQFWAHVIVPHPPGFFAKNLKVLYFFGVFLLLLSHPYKYGLLIYLFSIFDHFGSFLLGDGRIKKKESSRNVQKQFLNQDSRWSVRDLRLVFETDPKVVCYTTIFFLPQKQSACIGNFITLNTI